MNLDNYFAKFIGPKASAGASPRWASFNTEEVRVVPPTAAQATPQPAVAVAEREATASAGDVLPQRAAEEVGAMPPAEKRARVEKSPPAPSRPTATAALGNEDDDEDELAVLLGSQEAKKVKQQRAEPQGGTASPSPPVAQPSVCAVSELTWATRSNEVLENIAELFTQQLYFELHSNPVLFESFAPFFRERVLERIARGDALHPTLLPAPHITADTVGALPGCVLRDYQVDGVQFLLDHFHRGMSCILSDDMGLGKTAQVASFLHTLRLLHHIDGPHLIVAPLSTLTNWTRELARWAPTLKVVKYHGERKTREASRHAAGMRHAVLVTTPAVLNQDRRFFRKRSWVTVVVDEAHVLKGRDTQITTTARKLKACFRLAVTGTPVHNDVREVWSLMSYLYPTCTTVYGSSSSGSDDPAKEAEDCARLLHHVMLRRSKEMLELGIPPRVEEPLVLLQPTYTQLELLSRLTASALEESDDARRLQGHLSHQRAVCNHPLALQLLAAEGRLGSSATCAARLEAAGIAISDASLVHPSAKMVYLDTVLRRKKLEGHRCLLFSNFTSTLDLLQGFCVLRGYSFERLDGGCNRVERELAMLRFNDPSSSCFLFLVTTTAGGVGVTLTGADTVFLYDAHFNPQLDRQAADRAHRIGQTRVVHVYRLCLQGTVEERIREIADRKASLGDLIVDGARGSGRGSGGGNDVHLSAEDIRSILERTHGQRHEQRQRAVTTVTDSGEFVESTEGLAHSTRADADRLVEHLVEIERSRLDKVCEGRGGGAHDGAGHRPPNAVTHTCLVCGAIMHKLEPLYHCTVCPKAYHAECIGEPRPRPGEAIKNRHWTCPRHHCHTCGKTQAADGAIFMCVSCPRAFCFDCLDPRYFVLDSTGSHLLNVQRTYDGMAAEGVEEKRSCYYISCLRCCGVESPSGSSSSASSSASASDVDESDGEGN